MTLDDLVTDGHRILTGCDKGIDGDACTITFVLDGRAYRASEDPADGYRSCLGEIIEVPAASVINVFPPCIVRTEKVETADMDVLRLVDVVTGEVVLHVGTENTADYYPYYVAYFWPNHMAINQVAR